MKRDSARRATDGIASTNPTPLAIPILCKQALPPDRLSCWNTGSLAGATAKTLSPTNDVEGVSQAAAARSKELTASSGRLTAADDSNLSLDAILELGHGCAKLLNA